MNASFPFYIGKNILDKHVSGMGHFGAMAFAFYAPDTIGRMWPHFVNLLRASWQSFLAGQGTTSLGLVTPLVVSIISVLLTFFVIYQVRGKRELVEHWKGNAAIALLSAVIVNAFVYAVLFGRSVIHEVYDDHQYFVTTVRRVRESDTTANSQLKGSLTKEVADLKKQNSELKVDLDRHRHGMVTTDPMFANTIYLLQAFRMYRVALGPAKCTIYVTAPPDSEAIASMTAQFQINVSNCATFGPMGTGPPSLEKEALDGSTPGFVTINAPENDRAADELMSHLNSVFRVKRGYRTIPKGRLAQYPTENVVWMQFGQQTAFNSELRGRGK